MQIFINETSLHEQYRDRYHFLDSFGIFISSIKRISEIKNKKDVLNSNSLFYCCGLSGEVFQSTIKSNPALNQAFALNLQQLNPKSWQGDQKHETISSYEYNNEDFVTTSVAEISERSIMTDDFSGFLLNFSESKFGEEPTISILKNNSKSIVVDTVITPEAIESWLIAKGFLNPNEVYDENSRIAPADFQTILRDETVFEKTNYPRNNGRIVYRKIGTNELWAVDNALKHAGAKAHIEVFDENTASHLGTSLYNQDRLDTSFKVKNRTINLG